MRKHLTYANVAATLALVFAMTGGALAAKHYLINSTNQINPKVLKKLRGAKGATGTGGATGATGSAGKEGAPGTQGPEGRQGPPSEAISAHVASVAFPGSPEAAEVATEVSLPAGSYTLLATVDVQNTGGAGEAECLFLFGATTLDATVVTLGAKDTRSMALSSVVSLPTPTQMKLACKTTSTTGNYVNPTLTATKAILPA